MGKNKLTYEELEQRIKELENSEALYHGMIENSHDLFWQCDPKGRYTYVSSFWQEVLGYQTNEMLGKKFADFLAQEQVIPDSKGFNLMMQGNAVKSLETTYLSKEGKKIHLVFNAKLINDKEGNILGISGNAIDITKHKQFKESVRKNRLFLRTIIDNFPGMIGYWDIEQKCQFSNSAYHNFFGKTKEQMVDITLKDLMSAELYTKNKPYLLKVLSGKLQTFEGSLVKADGTTSHTWMQYIPDIENEEVKGFLAIVADITQAKQTQFELEKLNDELVRRTKEIVIINQSLHVSERKYRNLVENSLVGIYHSNIAGEIVYANNAFVKMYGFDSEKECRDYGVAALYKDPKVRIEFLRQLQQKGKVEGFEVKLISKNGNEHTFLLNSVLDEDIIQGSIIDITERKKAEEALHDSQRFLSDIIENNGAIIYAKDLAGRYELVNRKWTETTGYKREDTLGKTAIELFPGEIGDAFHKSDIQIMQQDKITELEEKLVDSSGERVFFTIKFPLFDKNNKVRGICGMSSEVTERRQQVEIIRQKNEELAKSNATKDKFFSVIAHDLRGPLSAMCSFSQLLINDFDLYDTVTKKEFITIINTQAEQTIKLLENLLDWSRLQRGFLKPDYQLHYVNSLIMENVMLLNENANQKGILIQNNTNNQLRAYCDKNMTSTILRNLISNAVKFAPTNGIITILATEKNNFIEFQVADNGIGTPPEKISSLFNIASNKSTLGTANERGTGLGLPLCKELVEKLGGKIWVVSEVGKGSTFYFTIDIRQNSIKSVVSNNRLNK